MANESTKVGAILALAGVVITSIISASVTYTQIRTQQIVKEAEIKSQEILRGKELDLKRIDQDQKVMVQRGNFIFDRLETILRKEQSVAVKALLFWSLGEEEAKRLFSYIHDFGSQEEKAQAAAVLETIIRRQGIANMWSGSWDIEIPELKISTEMKVEVNEGLLLATYFARDSSPFGFIRGFFDKNGVDILGNWFNVLGQHGSINMRLKSHEGKVQLEGEFYFFPSLEQKHTFHGSKRLNRNASS
jgi:hypothetical protein